MAKNEYGGYLSFEQGEREYYADTSEYNTYRLNAARYAMVTVVKQKQYGCVYLPYYICQSVVDAFERERIDVKRYHINNRFEPAIESIDFNSVIVIPNYYGVFGLDFAESMLNRFDSIIFDNTQSFFSPPILRKGVYNVYSPRKFVGVSDGAYLISKESFDLTLLFDDYSSERCGYLYESLEKGTNDLYQKSLKAEIDLSESEPRRMSVVTRAILSNLDYDRIKRVRRRNFRWMHTKLKGFNGLSDMCSTLEWDRNLVPMVYPVLMDGKGEWIRHRLIKNKIYVPQWWKVTEENMNSDNHEKNLSRDLIPVPIDQRYSLEDLQNMLDIIMSVCQIDL